MLAINGGHDPGAVADSIEEEDITLETAFVLQRELIKHGFDSALTRTDDTDTANFERAIFSNRHDGDAYIAIHCNAAIDHNARGWEILYGNNCQSGQNLAAAIGVSLNLLAIPARADCVKPESRVGRGQGFRLTVLHNTRAPACLIEMGFITNHEDLAYMMTAEGKRLIAEAIVKGVINFFA